MTKPEALYRHIIKQLPEAKQAKMFGALCIKANNGKLISL